MLSSCRRNQIIFVCDRYVSVYFVKYGDVRCLCNSLLLQIVNQHLLKDLTELGVWNDEMKNLLIAHNGSVQVLIVPGYDRHLKLHVTLRRLF